MTDFRHLVRSHGAAFACALILAALVVSPHVRVWLTVGPEQFAGVYPTLTDDEVAYQARIKEFLEGNFSIGNPYIYERRDDPFIMPPIAEGIVAALARLTGAPVPFVTAAGDVLFTIPTFLILYALFLTIARGRRRVSLAFALLFFVFFLSTFGRPVSPQVNGLFLLAGLLYTVRMYLRAETVRWGSHLGAGVLTGVTCFISPYYFTALLAVYGALFAFRSIAERSAAWVRGGLPWFLAGFLPLGLTYAFFQLRATGDASYGETVLRYGLMHTHIPGSYTNVALGILALGVVAAAWYALSRTVRAFGLGLVASIIALNWQNVLTGKSLQFSSHYLLTTILFVLMVLAAVLVALLERRGEPEHRARRAFALAGCAFVLAVVGHNQRGEFMNVAGVPYTRAELAQLQQKVGVFEWLNEHTPEDSVVYTLGGDYDFLVPVYTHNRVYYNFYAALYPAHDSETEERWLIQEYFNGGMSTTTIRERQREFWGNQYMDSYQSRENRKKILAFLTGGDYVPGTQIPEDRVLSMYAKWSELRSRPVEETLSTYRIDYILLSSEYPYFEDARDQIERMNRTDLVASVGDALIYKFDRLEPRN